MSSFFPQSTFFGLDLMGNALQQFSVAENVTSDNITNVNTPGASRQQAQFTEQVPLVGPPFMATHVPGTAGQGVVIAEIQRIHSNSYDALFRGASSSQNYYQTQQNVLQGVQSQLGDPNAGVSTAFSNFQTAINQLVSQAASGSPGASQANVLTSAQALATSLAQSATAVSAAKAQTLSQGATIVTTVNGILDQIAALNGQIRASTAVGDHPNTFADQRDYLIDQLSQYLSTNTSIQSDGSTLVSVNGQALVNDTVAYHLAAPVVGQASNGTQSFNVYFATNPTTSSSAPSIPLGSGQLAAMQDLYNNKLSVYGAQLDQFATGLSNEVNRITEASYDSNGEPGTALFQPIVSSLPISASNIKCGILNPSQLPVALANTNAGTLIKPMNSANNTIDTILPIDGDTNLANPPAADVPGPGGTVGGLTVTLDGITTTMNYQTNATIPLAAGQVYATSVNQFVTNFNALQSGVTASFDTASQSIVFARDPSNESLALRGAQQNNPVTPSFTVTDLPTTGAGILSALNASGINGVQQDATNAFAKSDNGGANAIVSMLQNNVGIPQLETTSVAAAVAGVAMSVALPVGINNIAVGQVLTLGAQPGGVAPQENVTVTSISVNPATGIESVTFTPANAHVAGFSVASAPVQTLQQFYGQLITQVGLDTKTAITGTTAQTNLTQSIDSQRQAISGINLDEETQNLIKFQNAYSAAAKTISTLNSMLGTIINGLGVGS
ncbi:MAG TPA: flagellar basal body rod C-terminal domain-containing protein [Candidatus Baltobacteraceae bacterium]|nr:flagellar basal body rod C-terminal domain-containing protein [Candidatus Baltobacteraceae bacterium]